MGWEKRGNSKYYYRKKRIGNRVYSIYVGKGEDAEKAYIEDLKNRNLKRKQYFEATQAILIDRKTRKMLAELESAVRKITGSHYEAAGFHKRKGQWRKRRHG